jgi:hypothetical protein
MTTQNTETTSHTRPLTDAEKKKMRRVHWMIIPAILIPALIIWVVSMVDSLPNAAKYATYTIGVGVVLVIASKLYKLERDLENGEAEVIRGILEDKYKFGGKKGVGGSGIGPARGRKNSSQATYILVFAGKKYWVRQKIYKQAEKGAHSEMVWLPNSQYVVSIQKV